jgi:hypothetical protein
MASYLPASGVRGGGADRADAYGRGLPRRRGPILASCSDAGLFERVHRRTKRPGHLRKRREAHARRGDRPSASLDVLPAHARAGARARRSSSHRTGFRLSCRSPRGEDSWASPSGPASPTLARGILPAEPAKAAGFPGARPFSKSWPTSWNPSGRGRKEAAARPTAARRYSPAPKRSPPLAALGSGLLRRVSKEPPSPRFGRGEPASTAKSSYRIGRSPTSASAPFAGGGAPREKRP